MTRTFQTVKAGTIPCKTYTAVDPNRHMEFKIQERAFVLFSASETKPLQQVQGQSLREKGPPVRFSSILPVFDHPNRSVNHF